MIDKKLISQSISRIENTIKNGADSHEIICAIIIADDRGDELSGGSFAVDGVYQLTPAGKKYQDKIQRKCWNEFG